MSEHFRLSEEGIEVRFSPVETQFLTDMLRMLGGLGTQENDPGTARLNLPAYLNDPDADEEWRRLAGSELAAARRADRSALELVLDGAGAAHERGEDSVVVSILEAHAMMRVINEARLALGARWGIDEPDDYERLRPEASDVISFLGWLVSDLAMVLGGALGRP